jgi:hypothetical protein
LLTINKILLPLDLQETVLPAAVIHQAVALVHHFHSELLILHVVKPLSYLGGSETTHELLKEDIANEHAKLKII